MWTAAFFLLWTIFASPAIAQEMGDVPTLYRSGWTPSSTQDVTVYGPMELERRGGKLVEDILVSDESIHMVRSAGPSGRTATFLHGIDSDHILFLIDGVEVNDPIAPGRSFEFSQMPTSDIERIEVIKGGDGIRHGSGANAAVINIVTKQGVQKRPLKFAMEAGSYGTVRGRVNGSAGTKDYSINIGAGGGKSEGISAAAADKGNSEKDGFIAKNLLMRIGSRLTVRDWIDFSSRYQILDSALDNHGGEGGDDPNHVMKTTESTIRGSFEHGSPKDAWNLRVFSGGNRIVRRQDNPPDPAHLDSEESAYYFGQSSTSGVDQSWKFADGSKILGGLSYKRDEGSSTFRVIAPKPIETVIEKQHSQAGGIWLQHMSPEQYVIFTDIGSRFEEYNLAGKVFGFHGGLGIHLFDRATLLRLRLERGYKIPTIYQLYSANGSQDLKNEKSLSWNAGLEQSLGPIELKLGIFKHLLTDLVDFNPALRVYQNIGSVETHGYEVAAETTMLDDLTVKMGYARTEHRNGETGEPLLRRPRHKATLDVSRFVGNHTRLTASILYVGRRKDQDFATPNFAPLEVKAYTTFTSTVNYSLSSDVDFYIRGENLTDAHYEEVSGYGTPGRSGFLGATIAL
jgi:vitamin B12 transporter